MRARLVSSGSVRVFGLRKLLGEIDAELVVRVGEDGSLYLAHQFTPDYPAARICLDEAEPRLESIERHPRLKRGT